jgi:AcrR family transcriptional regulator
MKTALQKAREAPSSTKARILAAAEEVFAARGFDGSSTREIAAAAGVNISSLHYHWESKETLYLAVLQDIYDRIIALARQSVRTRAGGAGGSRAAIETTLGRLIDFFLDHPTIPRLLLRRLLERGGGGGPPHVERDILSPAWVAYGELARQIGLPAMRRTDAQLTMLTINSVLLVFTLDSHVYGRLLGGRLANPVLRRNVRAHIIGVALRLLYRGGR